MINLFFRNVIVKFILIWFGVAVGRLCESADTGAKPQRTLFSVETCINAEVENDDNGNQSCGPAATEGAQNE